MESDLAGPTRGPVVGPIAPFRPSDVPELLWDRDHHCIPIRVYGAQEAERFGVEEVSCTPQCSPGDDQLTFAQEGVDDEDDHAILAGIQVHALPPLR